MKTVDIIDNVTGLIRPDERPAKETDRVTATAAVRDAVAAGTLPAQEGRYRMTAIEQADTRGQLRHALRGVGGGVPSAGVTTALGVAGSVWLLVTVVQIAVWLVIAFATGGPDGPWWLYSTVVGGAIVAGLWAVNESGHRRPGGTAGTARTPEGLSR